MHLLATTTASLEDLAEPVDLGQTPAALVALSFTDSDLAGLAAAWRAEAGALPEMRLASLAELKHPMSVDLWVDRVARHARMILVRVLGGYDWWRYGCDRLAATAREHGIALALLPGESHERDERLAELSTLPSAELDALLAYFRSGGPDNMRALVRRVARHAGAELSFADPRPLPKVGFYDARTGGTSGEFASLPIDGGIATRSRPAPISPSIGVVPRGGSNHPVVPILFYRSMLLAADVAPVDALVEALERRGIAGAPIFVSSLKDPQVIAFIEQAAAKLAPAAIIATTAFASSADPGAETPYDRIGVPVFQAYAATTRREAWASGQRGLAPADLAMHVVLPELDGRIHAGALGFKAARETDAALAFRGQLNRAEPDRIEQVAARVAAMIGLQRTPPSQRRVAILMPDYPGAAGRTGYAVGLDVPGSVLAMLQDMKVAGYTVEGIPETPRALLDMIERGDEAMALEEYEALFATLPAAAQEAVEAAWGEAACAWHPASESVLFRAARFGNVVVGLAPERGRSEDRRADYHDPKLPPRHELIAFGLWLRHGLDCHALVHVGAHGTLEWLPGKTVALSESCFPEIVAGALPVVYPFIVSNPGEAAQAKRRIGAVTIGHLPPPLTAAGLDEAQQRLERLVDEYAQADGLDRRRRDRLAKLIVDTARETGLAGEAGIAGDDDPDAALVRIDAWLCDLKDLAIKDGLHVYGRTAPDEHDALRLASARAERDGLLAALDGRHIAAGPSGAPARGRSDVLPTGRNLFAADPRTMPTPTAYELGKAAADEVLRRYAQDHGDWPRSLVLDLWGSASLRTGGEEIAQGLALMGCRPQWDPATGRVTGIEVLPPAALGRPRVDVTFRISGLFRDMFPAQIALIDAAVGALSGRTEAEGDNPLAEEAGRTGERPRRVFGTSPGTYGAGIEELLAGGRWEDREEIGRAFMEATSHAYGGADGTGEAVPEGFKKRLAAAELLVHTGDDPGRDMLEGSADVAFIGGFAAALAALGRSADLISLDTTDPARPRARSVGEAVARVVRARAVNPRFIEGQMRHGPRGAAEFAETVDRLVGFAETTNAIPAALIDAVHDAYLGDARVRDFLLRENPQAARAIAQRLAAARRRGLWHPLRNSVDHDLATLIAEAHGKEFAA